VVVADGDYVLLHGRFINNGRARAWVAGDVVRIENGLLAEHWDTLQDEVPREESVSGLPMFGDHFSAAPPALTVEMARTITAPLYDALRGQATGTPTGEFWGAQPAGKSFNTMAIDVFSVRGDKLAMAYHVENWIAALQQMQR
jgi:hypothetical protein